MTQLERFRKDNGMTQKELADLLGIGQSFVSQIEHSDRPMPEAVRDKLLSLEGVDKSAFLRKWETEESGKERALLTGSHMVPVLPIVAHGGKLTDFIASVQESDCEWAISPIPGADMIIPITGDSMAPEYNSGDRVVVKRVTVVMQKTQKPIYIPLGANAEKWLPKRGNEDDLVFPGIPPSPTAERMLAAWAKAAGLSKHVTFHVARHTHATLLLTYGADIYTVSAILGHKNVTTTQIYAKIVDQKRIDAINAIPDL